MEGRWGQTGWDCLEDGERRNRMGMGNRKEREKIFETEKKETWA